MNDDKIDAAARQIHEAQLRGVEQWPDAVLTAENIAGILRRHFAAEPQPADHPEPSVTQNVCPALKFLREQVESDPPFQSGSLSQLPFSLYPRVEKLMNDFAAELTRDLQAAKDENERLKGWLLECAINSAESTGIEATDMAAAKQTCETPIEGIADLVNSRVCDLECQLADRDRQITEMSHLLSESLPLITHDGLATGLAQRIAAALESPRGSAKISGADDGCDPPPAPSTTAFG